MAGIKFGQYLLLRRIARGGMAEVFLAQQRGLEGFDRRVAVKRILPHLADSPDFVKMFLGEAKLAAQLTHPNIVHIYDFGKVEQDYFIAMEYVDGVHAGQLFKLAERTNPQPQRLPPTLVARLGADAAAALNYAHELRGPNGKPLALVHRDVSPANLMVSFDGIVKLCDFGIAKAAALSDQLTNPGQVKGKYAYMSPEQTVAAPLDGRSDVFSLAICLWELLAGKTIVGRGDTVEAMRAIRDGKLEPIESAAPDTPKALAEAMAWAMQTRRDKRATAAEFATALEAFIKTSPEIATPMQLSSWLKARVSRTETGEQPALDGAGTQAGPGTAAGPGTVGGDANTPDQPHTSPTASILPSSLSRTPEIRTPRRPTTPPPDVEGVTARRRPSEAETPQPLVRPRRASEMEQNTMIAASRRPRAPSEEDDAETVAYDENGPLGMLRGREPAPPDMPPERPSWEATRLVSNRAPSALPSVATPRRANHSPRVIVDPKLRPPTPSVDPLPSLPPSLRQEMGLEQALGSAGQESNEHPLHPNVLETVEAELLDDPSEEESTGGRSIRDDETIKRSPAQQLQAVAAVPQSQPNPWTPRAQPSALPTPFAAQRNVRTDIVQAQPYVPPVISPTPVPVISPTPVPNPRPVNAASLSRRGPATDTTGLVRSARGPRIAIAIGILVALAVASFAIVTLTRGKKTTAPVDAAPAPPPGDAHGMTVVPMFDAAPEPIDAAPAVDGRNAFLEISTTPAGATMKVGDQTRVSPAQFALVPGKYVVTVELAGYTTETREVEIEEREHLRQEIALVQQKKSGSSPSPSPSPTSGFLSARTDPYSDVYDGAKLLGQTPFADLALAPGAHTLTFKNPNKRPVTKQVTIVAGKTTKLAFNL